MLSENSLESLAQPIIERQEEINVYVLKKLAKQIKDIGELSPSSIDRLRFMLKSGDDAQLVNRALADYEGKFLKGEKPLFGPSEELTGRMAHINTSHRRRRAVAKVDNAEDDSDEE